jgi:hypothetical protein
MAPLTSSERAIAVVLVVTLLTTAILFRILHLSSMPGVSGDEGWWGMQSLAWLANRPYEAHTTSGNPTDLLFLVPVAYAQEIGPPSFTLLRLVPALVNLIALPIGFWFVRRVYGRTTAWIYTVALAIQPTAIAHSRITQDPSQSIFWTGLVVYLSLLAVDGRNRAWAFLGLTLAFPAALWTHPTNVFVAPFVLAAVVAAIAPLVLRRVEREGGLVAPTRRRAILVVAGIVLLTTALVLALARSLVAYMTMWSESLDKPWVELAAVRVTDGRQWFEFAANNGRLFNGVTVYHYFSGARPTTLPYDTGFVLVALAVSCALVLAIAVERRRTDMALAASCVATWIGFYLFAGPQALRPHAERWGLCLIVPAMLVLARGVTVWIERAPRLRWITIGAASCVAALLLASFYVNYFREFAVTGGGSHLAYVTAPIEPKQQALQLVLSQRGASSRATIVTQQWWLYWPIAYLASAHPGVTVVRGAPIDRPADVQDAVRDGTLFVVEFVDTPELTSAIGWVNERGLRVTRTAVRDASGRELLEVLQVAQQ